MKQALTLVALLGAAAATPASAQTITNLVLHNTAYNGLSGSVTPGTIYNFPNAATGVDAFIKVVGVNKYNTQGGTSPVDYVALATIDNPYAYGGNTVGGFDAAFQPAISSSTNSTGLWQKGNCSNGNLTISHSANQDYQIHFRLFFKKAGTSTNGVGGQDTALNLNAAFLDIDGFGSSTEYEQDAFMPGESYAVSGSTSLTVAGKTTPYGEMYNAKGTSANIANITATPNGTVQVRYRNRTYVDFAMGMKTNTGGTSGGCYPTWAKGRLFSASFATTCQPPYSPPCPEYTTVCISGTVWHDANNSANGTFNNINQGGEPGTDGSVTGGVINPPFYAYALDSVSGTIIGKAEIPSSGYYTIADIPQRTPVRILISTVNVPVGTTNGFVATTTFKNGSIPAGWVPTTPRVRPAFVTGGPLANVTNQDFGINYVPTDNNNTQPASTNPNAFFTIPATAFTGSDLTPGVLDTIIITSYPTFVDPAGGLKVGNVIYRSNATGAAGTTLFPAGGIKITANNSGNPLNQAIQIKPVSGNPTVVIPFKVRDNGNAESDGATVSKPFNTPLAVTLTSFEAAAEGRTSRIQWATSSEEGTIGFDVEWSADAKAWKSIGTQAAAGRGSEYTMRHTYPAAGANYYRLRTLSLDGTTQYSEVARVQHAASASKVAVGPNPATNLLWFDGADGSTAIVTDAAGREVARQTIAAGSTMNIQRFTAGVYTITLRDATGAVQLTERIVKQ